MALEVYLILLQPANIELLARSATPELSSDVFLVVTDDPVQTSSQPLNEAITMSSNVRASSPCDDASSADTFRSLSNEELASLLYGLIDIVTLVCAVRDVIVGDVVEAVHFKELWGDDPWAVFDYFVYPFAVSHGLGALLGRHDCQPLALVGLTVAGDAYNEGCVGEGLLRLLKLAHVSIKPVSTSSTST